jgi:hypothetical protein
MQGPTLFGRPEGRYVLGDVAWAGGLRLLTAGLKACATYLETSRAEHGRLALLLHELVEVRDDDIPAAK